MLIEIQKDSTKKFAFWNQLILLKWILTFSVNSPLRKMATSQDMDELIVLVEKMESDHKVIDFSKGIMRGIRIIAFQQFWAQDSVTEYTFERQLVLFRSINGRFDIGEDFHKRTKLNLVTFINLAYTSYLYSIFYKIKPGSEYSSILKRDYFDLVEAYFIKEDVIHFLDLLTIKNKHDVSNLHRMTNEVYQLYDASFLALKPLVLHRNVLFVTHRTLLEECARHFIYNYMKLHCKKFPEEFGLRMEKYIALGLQESGITFRTETMLKSDYPSLTKVSDFLVGGNILVESKAIELHPRSGILRNESVLYNEFQDSVIKSYKQILATANTINKNIEWFGVVITYKDLYCGFGYDAWEEFLKEPITSFCADNDLILSVVPPENICFINLNDWDVLVQNVKNGISTFQEMITHAIEMNRADNPNEKILLFEQCLRMKFPINQISLDFLKEANRLLINRP